MEYRIGLLLCLLLWSNLARSSETSLEWNEANIDWFSYEEGLRVAERSGKPALVVFYADWCATCHSYRNLFNDPVIATLAKNLVMIRIDADARPDLNASFADDGLYLPRSYGLASDGTVMKIASDRAQFHYFYAATDVVTYARLMRSISKMRILPL